MTDRKISPSILLQLLCTEKYTKLSRTWKYTSNQIIYVLALNNICITLDSQSDTKNVQLKYEFLSDEYFYLHLVTYD